MTGQLETLKGRRPALIAGSVFICFISAMFALFYYGDISARDAEVAENIRQLSVFRSVLSQSVRSRTDYDNFRRNLSTRPSLLHGDSAILAGAKMQGDMKAIISKNGGNVSTSQLLPINRDQGLEIISARYDLNVPINHLQSLLFDIESHVPYFTIETADISAPQFQNSRNVPMRPNLDVHLTVRGYRWAGAN